MFITLASYITIPGKSITFKAIGTNLGFIQGRIATVKLIDGTNHIQNAGVRHNDRIFQITAQLTTSQIDDISYLFELSENIIVATEEGIFLGIIESLDKRSSPTVFKIFISSKIVDRSEIYYPDIYVPPAGGWEDKTSDTYWVSDGNASYAGGKWTNDTIYGINFYLSPSGGWESGYRPTKIRITYDAIVPNDFISPEIHTNNDQLNPDNGEYESLEEDSLTFPDPIDNIQRLYIYNTSDAETIQITNIEFYDSGWVSIFDNTKWQVAVAGYGVWDTDHWELDTQSYIHLIPKVGETWQVGFRPTDFRITFALTHYEDIRVILYDTEWETIGLENHTAILEEIDLDFSGGFDIVELGFYAYGKPDYLSISKIEFYVET